MTMVFYSRAFYCALFLFCLNACSSPRCRQWEIQEALVEDPCFYSARMTLAPESETCHLELEIDRSRTGLRLYLNVLLLQVPPCPDDPNKAALTLLLEDGESMIVFPYILAGGQRLLFSPEVTLYLIDLLLDGQSFTIQLGRQRSTIILTNFQTSYDQLMHIPIVEE
jgi:hypothetical protein